MQIKKAIAYQGRSPRNDKELSLVADIVDIEPGNKYLIVDLYSDRNHIYRMIMCNDGYIHYDYTDNKTDRKSNWNNPYRAVISEAYISKRDAMIIKQYAEDMGIDKPYRERAKDYIDSIEDYIERKKIGTQELRKEAEMQNLFKMVPSIPEKLLDAIEMHADRCNLIYYKRHGNYADYKCCQCGQEYTLRNSDSEGFEPVKIYPVPRDGEGFTCIKCGKSARLKPLGRAKTTHQEFNTVLYQTAADETLIARIFYTDVTRDEFISWRIATSEKLRMFLFLGKIRIYYHGYSNNWYPVRELDYNSISTLTMVGEENIKNSCLRYMPYKLYTLLNQGGDSYTAINMHKLIAIESYARCTQLETLYKNGFEGMCRQILWYKGRTREIKKSEVELHRILKITKEQLAWLRQAPKQGFSQLKMIQFADSKKIAIKDYGMLSELWGSYSGEGERLEKALKYQSLQKLYNFISKNSKDYFESMDSTLREYVDYLKEREAGGYDMTNSVYIRPKHLHQTYMQLREETERKRDETYLSKMADKYPEITVRSQKIPARYTWENDGLMIRPAKDAIEIVMEGRILHHCVGSDSQRYMDNYNKGKAWIMVLRKKEFPNIPYITIELQCNTIVQWYGKNDTKPNRKIIEAFLKKYIEHIKPNRTKKTA